jgi:hypothetical protein
MYRSLEENYICMGFKLFCGINLCLMDVTTEFVYIQMPHLFAPMHGEEMDIGDSDNGDPMYLQVQCGSKGLEVLFL